MLIFNNIPVILSKFKFLYVILFSSFSPFNFVKFILFILFILFSVIFRADKSVVVPKFIVSFTILYVSGALLKSILISFIL